MFVCFGFLACGPVGVRKAGNRAMHALRGNGPPTTGNAASREATKGGAQLRRLRYPAASPPTTPSFTSSVVAPPMQQGASSSQPPRQRTWWATMPSARSRSQGIPLAADLWRTGKKFRLGTKEPSRPIVIPHRHLSRQGTSSVRTRQQ